MRRDELNLPEPPPYDRPSDHWMCGVRRDPCPNGPTRSGKCPLAAACQPKRSWAGKRRRIVVLGLVVVGLLMIYAASPSAAPKVFKPGNLATPHAQILSGTLTSDRCASCHESAATSPNVWFLSAGEGHADVSQTDRCLKCHHKTIEPSRAKLAHNLPFAKRRQIRNRIRLTSASEEDSWHDALPGPAVDQEDIACATCHREHGGANADLLAVTDAQCQTCHDNRFGSFATSHPQWEQWPYGRGGEIAFDHQSHMTKHFPGTQISGAVATFACESCHVVNEHNELTRSVSYETGCQSCHDDALKLESAKGFDLFALPTVPEPAANLAGEWPVAARGFMEGEITPLSDLLMRVDPSIADTIAQIPGRDLIKLDPNNPQTNASAATVAAAHRVLLLDLANQGHPALIKRGTQAGVSPKAMALLIRTLPPQILIQAYEKWFPETAETDLKVSRRTPVTQIRQVDFAKALTTPLREQPSILLPILSEEELLFGVPFISKRLQGNSVVQTQFDSARDNILLGQSGGNLSGNPNQASPGLSLPNNGLLPGSGAAMQTGPNQFHLSDQTGSSPQNGDDLLPTPQTNTGDSLLGDPLAAGDGLLADPLAIDPLATDPLATDPLATDPLATDPLNGRARIPGGNRAKSFSPSKMMPNGGWYRDDIRLAIGYRGSGHSDPVLKAIVEVVHQLPPNDLVRARLLSNRSVAACVSCHTGARDLKPEWQGRDLVGRKNGFTKFAHAAHLNVATIADCKHCHTVNTNSAQSKSPISLASFLDDSVATAHQGNEFLPINRQACAACHTPKAAGDSCVTCHRYHIHP